MSKVDLDGSYFKPLEKLRGCGSEGGECEDTIELGPKDEAKMGEGMKGGNPLETERGRGEVIGTVVGETRGDAVRF